MIEPLATAGQSQLPSPTNLSRSVSFSILDRQGNEISLHSSSSSSDPIEVIIPRDPSAIILPMTLQNVTAATDYSRFYLHGVSLPSTTTTTSNLSVALHLEIRPLDITLAYALIYRFDRSPQVDQFNNWTLLCPTALNSEQMYTYFIDNQQTVGHQSVIFGLRELTVEENKQFCTTPSMFDVSMLNGTFSFTSNYELRTYTSACYYLDNDNQWQSDGLHVGPLTNRNQTQCFSFR